MADKYKKSIKDSRDKGEANKSAADETRDDVKRFGEARRRLPLAALLVLIVLIGVGVYFSWPSIQGGMEANPPEDVTASAEPKTPAKPVPTAPTEPSPALAALSEKVAALENALIAHRKALERTEANLAAANTSPPKPDPTLAADALTRLENLEERLSAVQPAAQAARVGAANSEESVSATAVDFQANDRLDALERALSTVKIGDSTAEINSLRTELASLGEQIATLRQSTEIKDLREVESGRTMVMVLAYTRLARAAAGATPFAREAEAFVAAAQANGKPSITFNNAMAQLGAHALAGTPTYAKLTTQFNDLALAVVKADADADDQGWVDATIGRLRRIITVRRVGGEIAEDSLEGQLNALHQALSSGDLAGAVALANALPDKSRRGAVDWLRGARARLAVEQALAVIEAEVTKGITASWPPAAQSEE